MLTNSLRQATSWPSGMDSNHEETSVSGISKLLIPESTTSHKSHVTDPIRTAFVHGGTPINTADLDGAVPPHAGTIPAVLV
jgi:hypothetical protein